jgi:hypothetical protein
MDNTENALVLQINQSGLEPESAASLKTKFLPFFEQAEEWKRKAETLVVTDISRRPGQFMIMLKTYYGKLVNTLTKKQNYYNGSEYR